MTDQLPTLLRESGEALAARARMEPPATIFRQGLKRRRQRRLGGCAAAVVLALGGGLSWISLTHGAGEDSGQLANDRGSSGGQDSGRFAITVETAPSAPAGLAGSLARCAKAAGAAQQAQRSRQLRYTAASGPAADQMLKCAQNQVGVVRITGTDRDGASPAPTFTEASVNAIPGTLRSTGISNIQTWLSDAHDGTGTRLCWGQADPFESACSATVQPKAGGPAHPYPGLNPPSEDTRSRLIAGVVVSNATGGKVLARGQTLMAAVEHYDQFPGYAIVVAQYIGEHVSGENFGPIGFAPGD